MFRSPAYDVRPVPVERIRANEYNPNSVAPPEMKLLYKSILEDGYTMPIVCYYIPEENVYEIVDGFHRWMIMLKHKDIYEREHGMIPVTVIDKDISNRMASTIRHNRARGTHDVELMKNIVAELVEAGVDSFKIEGRAKSAYYTAIVTNAYRAAIDGYLKNPSPDYKPEKWICEEPYKVSFRDYCTGFYFDDPKTEANISLAGGYRRIWDVMGVVQESDGKFLTVAQRNKFCVGDTLELLEKGKCPKTFTVSEMFLPDGTPIDAAPHPMMILKIPVLSAENISSPCSSPFTGR